MKKLLAIASIVMFALTSTTALAQSNDNDVATGGPAGSDNAQTSAYGAAAAVGAIAVVGTAVALASSGDDNHAVDVGDTGTTGTTGTTGPTGTTGTTGTN